MEVNETPAYHRVLLKLSGEALANNKSGLYDYEFMDTVVANVKECLDMGVQVAIVVGGGNIKVVSFVRFDKGEGIEKKEEDFAAEIEKMVKG